MLNEMMMMNSIGSSMQNQRQSSAARLELFERTVLLHFNVEEQILFPLYLRKSPKAKQTVAQFCSEHNKITDSFQRYRKIDDQAHRVKSLSVMMSSLALHTRGEDIFFSSITLTRKESTRAAVVARAIGFPIL